MIIKELEIEELLSTNGGSIFKLIGKIHGTIVGAIVEVAESIVDNANPDITTLKM